jgi:hypothetical protein
MVLGSLIFIGGVLVTLLHKAPFFGKLPGDIVIQRRNFTFYFPLATSLLLSVLLSLVMWLFSSR